MSKPLSYDLHLHTCWSYDATNEPEIYFQQASRQGLKCIAITEHHNLDSLAEAEDIAKQYPGIHLIVAAELSVTTSIGPVDLLCYHLPSHPSGALAEVLEEYRRWIKNVARFRVLGARAFGLDYSESEQEKLLRGYRPERVLSHQGITHECNAILARYFIERGFISSREEYDDLLERISLRHPCPYPAVERVVSAVKQAGGLVVIAHPARIYFRGNDLHRMDALREECGLDGIECAHPSVPQELTVFYRAYCRKHGLVSTAGSDAHNPADVQPSSRHFGCQSGEDEWLEEFLERLPPLPRPAFHNNLEPCR